MAGLIYKREEEWADDFPFASLADVSKFSAEFNAIIREALPEPPVRMVFTGIDYPEQKTGTMSPTEFHDALPDLPPLSEAEYIYLGAHFVDEEDPAAKADRSDFVARVYITPSSDSDYRNARLTVEGRKLTAVEGVKAAATAAINRRAKAKAEQEAEEKRKTREADERASRVARQIFDAEETRRRERAGTLTVGARSATRGDGRRAEEEPPPPKPSRWKRFRESPWAVQAFGGAIGGVLTIVVVYVVSQVFG